MKGLVAIAVLSLALQPCLACARGQDGPEVRSEGSCHGASHEVVTACPEGLGADVAVVPTGPVGIPGVLPVIVEVVLPQHALLEATAQPSAPVDGPPLWLRHVSLLV